MDVAKSSSHCKKYLKYNTNTAVDRQGKEAFLFNYQMYIIYGTGFDVALNYANKDRCSSRNSVFLQNNQIKGWFKHKNQRVK